MLNMLKRTLTLSLAPIIMLPLQGCFTDAIRGVEAYNNVRSGYQAYQGITGIKDFEKAKPVMRSSDSLYVKTDLKPSESAEAMNAGAAQEICAAFDREFMDMKAHDLNRGRHLSCLSAGDVPANAVVLNVRELVETSRLMRVVQSDTIKSESSWVTRDTGAILDQQANPGYKTHKELIEYIGSSLSIQILRSLAPEQSDPDYPAWAQKVEAWSKARAQANRS